MILKKVETVTQLYPDDTKDTAVALIFYHKKKYYMRRIKISTCSRKVSKRLRAEATYQIVKTYKELGLILKTKRFYYKRDSELIRKAIDLLIGKNNG